MSISFSNTKNNISQLVSQKIVALLFSLPPLTPVLHLEGITQAGRYEHSQPSLSFQLLPELSSGCFELHSLLAYVSMHSTWQWPSQQWCYFLHQKWQLDHRWSPRSVLTASTPWEFVAKGLLLGWQAHLLQLDKEVFTFRFVLPRMFLVWNLPLPKKTCPPIPRPGTEWSCLLFKFLLSWFIFEETESIVFKRYKL